MIEIEAPIIERVDFGQGIYSLRFFAPPLAKSAKPGQFIHLQCGKGTSHILRRPFSIGRRDDESITVFFERIGKGTEYLAQAGTGLKFSLIGPLGHGFETAPYERVDIIAGGMGFAPMIFLADELAATKVDFNFFLGSRTKDRISFLTEGLKVGRPPILSINLPLFLATDDGSLGRCASVIDLYSESSPGLGKADVIFACGPKPMLKAVSKIANNLSRPCFVSMEENMACGIGACLSCTCKGRYGQNRVCVEGPVFNIDDINWEEV